MEGIFLPKDEDVCVVYQTKRSAVRRKSPKTRNGCKYQLHKVRQERETKSHIFFNCPYAKEVWKSIPLSKAVHIAVDESFLDVIIKFRNAIFLPPTGIRGNVLPWIRWAICTSRNALVFDNRTFTPEETATKGLASANKWNLAQQKNQSLTSPLQNLRKAPSSMTAANAVTCNTYAAWDKVRKRACLAWTFSGSLLPIAMEDTSIEDFVGSPLMAEALAVRSALSKAVDLGISDINVYTDCTTFLGAINGKSQRKEIVGVVSDIKVISSVFASIFFFHVSTSQNSICDVII